MDKMIEVPASWFERLLELNLEVDKIPAEFIAAGINMNMMPIGLLGKLAQLEGYISSAKFILEQAKNN